MPFFRPRRRFMGQSRYPARPRFRRSSLRPTTAPSLQQCQFYFDQTVIIGDPGGPPGATNPSFLIQAMSPWANLSDSGYDSRFDLYGFNYNSLIYLQAPLQGTFEQQDVCRLCEMWFIDAVDLDGVPTSLGGATSNPYGPFVSLPPVVNPSTPQEDSLMPARTLKRTYFGIGEATNVGSLGGANAALAVHRGSGRVRVKRRLDDKQEWFWSLFGYPEDPATDELEIRTIIGGVAYYKLRR